MSEEIKDVNAKIDEAEAAVKKYASADTVISVGGYEFTPAKLMVAFTLVSSIIGGLYGCFQVYNDYMGMKDKIAKYVAPDLSEFDKRLTVIEQNQKETNATLQDAASKTADYTRDIKNDLKGDIRRLEGVVEGVERSSKQTARETDQQVRDVQQELRRNTKETDQTIKQVQREVDTKIQKALDNPLAGK
jgi:methyl-accepting chemotaxis protein